MTMISPHPYLAGAKKPFRNAVYETHITSKTKRGIPALRVPAEGSDRPVPKFFGKREQERAARRRARA